MKPRLKSFFSPDVDVRYFVPPDDNVFNFFITIFIGPEFEDGVDSFQMQICSPEWIILKNEAIFGYEILLVPVYSFDVVKSKIEEFLNNIDEPDWPSVAKKISRIASWEFEDYLPYEPTATPTIR